MAMAILGAMLFVACSDSSPTISNSDDSQEVPTDSVAISSSEQREVSSSSQKNQFGPGAWFNPWQRSSSSKKDISSSSLAASSSSVFKPTSSSPKPLDGSLSKECSLLRSTVDKFHKVTDILPCVGKDEKVAFILRHGNRNKSATGDTEGLNSEGRKQSLEFGKELKNVEDIFFMNTKVYRTMETVLKIAEGKEQKFSESKVPFKNKIGEDHEESSDFEDAYLIKDKEKLQSCRDAINNRFHWTWGWSPYSYYAYEENVIRECQAPFYDIDDRLDEFVKAHFTYEKMHNITIAISHDKLLVPMVIAVSQRKIDLRFHKHENDFNYWINYLTGFAVITDQSGNTTMIPATALKDGFLRTFPDN